MAFKPEEVLFSPTAECNLACPHCAAAPSRSRLSAKRAIDFLDSCKNVGVKRVGFTGGEPFLVPAFLTAVVRAAVERGYLFDRIMTNGVWWHGASELSGGLSALLEAGYDGDICVSVDAFHRQALPKVARLIAVAVRFWRRPDVVSLACVFGAYDKETVSMLRELARLLKGCLTGSPAGRFYIKSGSVFARVCPIDIAPVGRAAALKDPWDGRWFKDDRCKGPGNVFLVMPNGDVKPCCGYASDLDELTIGNIERDSAADLLRKARSNRFVRTVYESGLGRARRRLERAGVAFPGKTSSHCFLCEYILKNVPKGILNRCLDR